MRTNEMTKLWRGTSFRIAEGTTHPAYSLGTFEEEADFKDQHWNPRPGDVVVDVGASYGSYALTACAAGATVYAFEPESTVYVDLMRNVILNDWQGRCFVFNRGLWDEEAEVDMRSYAPHWPGATITGEYKMETFDGFAKAHELAKLDLLKIDVEGAELRVLDGAKETIRKYQPRLIVECHTFLDAQMVEKVEERLLQLGPYRFLRVDRAPCVLLVASVNEI